MRFQPTWSLRRFWLSWIKKDLQEVYYNLVYGIKFKGGRSTILPSFGKGKFVSVLKKGPYIDLVCEMDSFYKGRKVKKGEMIRIIPIQYNHGIAYEHWIDGEMCGRSLMSIGDFISTFSEKKENGLDMVG